MGKNKFLKIKSVLDILFLSLIIVCTGFSIAYSTPSPVYQETAWPVSSHWNHKVDTDSVPLLLSGKASAQEQQKGAFSLVVGGHSIGILLRTQGVTVVGHSPVISEKSQALYPAKEAGLEAGDFITKINGQEINKDRQVAEIVNKAGQGRKILHIEFLREQQTMEIDVKPLYCQDSGSFRIGLYIRDNTAGVGTLTFYDPKSNKYGALGHKVTNLEGYSSQEKDKGKIVPADIQGIKIGKKGLPGEKMGVFSGDKWQGNIENNSDYGIFGEMSKPLTNPYYSQPLPIALANQVKIGPAEIYTVLSGEKIEKFAIKINRILPNYRASGKGMIVEVTDPRLLEATGGIVQGMSGSPIIQDGRLVGAVTHVTHLCYE